MFDPATNTWFEVATTNLPANFYIRTPHPEDIKSVVLIRPGAATHAFDMEQRLVGMTFTHTNSQLYVKAPANGNLAPPGYYMVFILDSKGVPSKAEFVRLTTSRWAMKAFPQTLKLSLDRVRTVTR